jgi:hypothetical protein
LWTLIRRYKILKLAYLFYAHGYWYRYRLDRSGEDNYEYKHPSEEEYAAEENSLTQRVPEYSSSPPTRPVTPRVWSDPTPSESSYTASNSMEYSHSSQITSATTSLAQTVFGCPGDLWVSDAASEDSSEPQAAEAGTWSSGPVSKTPYSFSPMMMRAGAIPSAVKKYSVGRRFVPKAIKVLVDKKEHFSRPDTGFDRNIMSRAHAKKHGIKIGKQTTEAENFRLGTGTFAQSIGKVHIRVRVPGINFEKIVGFHVMKEFPNPLIMGSKFIEEIRLYTKNRHLLVEHPSFKHRLPILNRVGKRRQYIPFTADGNYLIACPDTGSELDFISEECVIRCGFEINASDDARRWIMLGDTSTVKTIGEVTFESTELKYQDTFAYTFHVLRGLPCDAIFGEELLENLDAFNTCEIILGDEESSERHFNGLYNMGPLQNFVGRLRYGQSAQQATGVEDHDRLIAAELYRRNSADREIPVFQIELWRTENARRAAFVKSHERCAICLSRQRGDEIERYTGMAPGAEFVSGLARALRRDGRLCSVAIRGPHAPPRPGYEV